MAGRPPTLTPEIHAKIVTAVRSGNYRSIAAKWAGVPLRTFFDWMRKGRSRARKNAAYRELLHAVQEAETAAEIEMVALVIKSAKDDPKHAQWWLERKGRERWGRDAREIAELKRQVAELMERTGGASRAADPRAPEAPGASGR